MDQGEAATLPVQGLRRGRAQRHGSPAAARPHGGGDQGLRWGRQGCQCPRPEAHQVGHILTECKL